MQADALRGMRVHKLHAGTCTLPAEATMDTVEVMSAASGAQKEARRPSNVALSLPAEATEEMAKIMPEHLPPCPE